MNVEELRRSLVGLPGDLPVMVLADVGDAGVRVREWHTPFRVRLDDDRVLLQLEPAS